jgi:hypothetical protein
MLATNSSMVTSSLVLKKEQAETTQKDTAAA